MKRFFARFVFVFLFSSSLFAQPYPAKPIRIIVPFPVGGIADIYSRLLGNRWTELWGQPVLVENRTGAGGNIGADLVAKSAPDGYTLGIGSIGTHAVNVSLFSKMPYDPVKDFAPITPLATRFAPRCTPSSACRRSYSASPPIRRRGLAWRSSRRPRTTC